VPEMKSFIKLTSLTHGPPCIVRRVLSSSLRNLYSTLCSALHLAVGRVGEQREPQRVPFRCGADSPASTRYAFNCWKILPVIPPTFQCIAIGVFQVPVHMFWLRCFCQSPKFTAQLAFRAYTPVVNVDVMEPQYRPRLTR
jgi:hypothetical protein